MRQADCEEQGGGYRPPDLNRLVHGIASDMERSLSAGDIAQLRRLRPDDAANPAFWKVIIRRVAPTGLLPEGGRWRDDAERRWAVILAGMAEMKGLHRPGQRLGHALAEAGVAEPRVLRLLRARDDSLLDAVRVIAHHLASAARSVDWSDFAWLVFSDGRPDRDAVRRRIARDYYSRTHR